jgi:hypothetical protein
MSQYDERSTAIHEAGHAVLAVILNGGLRKDGASIIPEGDTLGSVSPRRRRGKRTYQHYREDCIRISLAGGIAEYVYSGRPITGHGTDAALMMHDYACGVEATSPEWPQACTVLMQPLETTARDSELFAEVGLLVSTDSSAAALKAAPPHQAIRMATSRRFQFFAKLADETRGLVFKHWQVIVDLAEELLARKKMSGPQVEAFVRARIVPDRQKR